MTKLRCKESLQIQESAFEQDVRQLCKIVTLCSEKTLILLDEFGKGTDTIYGAALFGAVIKYLNERPSCPIVVASTHFGEIFKESILGSVTNDLIYLKTDISMTEQQQDSAVISNNFPGAATKLVYLYTISYGISTDSYGVLCAKLCGLQESIIKRALAFNKMLQEGTAIVDHLNTLDKGQIQELQKKQEIIKHFIEWDLTLETHSTTEDLLKKLKHLLSEWNPS